MCLIQCINYLPFARDYNKLHEAWVKFRDLKFEDDETIRSHSHLKYCIGEIILNGTITEAFDELVKGIEWVNTLNKKV